MLKVNPNKLNNQLTLELYYIDHSKCLIAVRSMDAYRNLTNINKITKN